MSPSSARSSTRTTAPVRFRIDQIRARSAGPWAIDGLIDVRYGPTRSTSIGATVPRRRGGRSRRSAALLDRAPARAAVRRQRRDRSGGHRRSSVRSSTSPCARCTRRHERRLRGAEPAVDDKRDRAGDARCPDRDRVRRAASALCAAFVWGWSLRGIFELGRAAVTPTTDHKAIRIRSHNGPDDATVRPARADSARPTGQATSRRPRRARSAQLDDRSARRCRLGGSGRARRRRPVRRAPTRAPRRRPRAGAVPADRVRRTATGPDHWSVL